MFAVKERGECCYAFKENSLLEHKNKKKGKKETISESEWMNE